MSVEIDKPAKNSNLAMEASLLTDASNLEEAMEAVTEGLKIDPEDITSNNWRESGSFVIRRGLNLHKPH